MKENSSTFDLLNKLLCAISQYYKNDNISPGLVWSKLKDGSIYCSIVRYEDFSRKIVVLKESGDSCEGVLTAISGKFLELIEDGQAINALKVSFKKQIAQDKNKTTLKKKVNKKTNKSLKKYSNNRFRNS